MSRAGSSHLVFYQMPFLDFPRGSEGSGPLAGEGTVGLQGLLSHPGGEGHCAFTLSAPTPHHLQPALKGPLVAHGSCGLGMELE